MLWNKSSNRSISNRPVNSIKALPAGHISKLHAYNSQTYPQLLRHPSPSKNLNNNTRQKLLSNLFNCDSAIKNNYFCDNHNLPTSFNRLFSLLRLNTSLPYPHFVLWKNSKPKTQVSQENFIVNLIRIACIQKTEMVKFAHRYVFQGITIINKMNSNKSLLLWLTV